MSFRDLVRQPSKRMLIYFHADNTTTIMETSKVKKIVQGNKVEEGARVLMPFGKKDFEATVIKLHGNCNIVLT